MQLNCNGRPLTPTISIVVGSGYILAILHGLAIDPDGFTDDHHPPPLHGYTRASNPKQSD